MEITAQMVKELRERSGAPMMQCKAALAETNGNMDEAVHVLRKKGIAAAEKRAGRVAADGTVAAYIHAGGKIGVLVEINCETDFVARGEEFQTLVKDIAMHIAAAEPRFLRREEVTEEILEREREVHAAQIRQLGKPEAMIPKIVAGKMEKFYSETVLLEQAFVKNPDISIQQMITEKVAKLGENIQVRRFVRYRLGEGIEKQKSDFAAEVAQAAG